MTGFDVTMKFLSASGGWSKGLLKNRSNTVANATENAPSVAEADAILAKFGYTETRELAAA